MAFDLVAKLTLQDDFSKQLKRIFKDMDQFKNNVNKVAHSSTDMAKKFNSAGTIASKSINKVSETTSRMQNMFSRAGDLSRNSLRMIGKGGESMRNVLSNTSDAIKRKLESIGRVTEPLRSKFSQASDKIRNSLNKAIPGDGLKNKITNIGRSVGGLPGKFSQATAKIRSSLKSGIETPAISAKGAIMGIASAVGGVALASKAFNMLKGSIEKAVSRYDTLNNFPRVMQAMGFSAEESKKSIDRLAKGIDGLPTALDEIASTAQRIATSSGDLGKATETAIALNNALLASGSDAEKASRGTEQYLKALSTGKMEMDSWTTLQETMGLGLNEVAKSFGITGDQLQNDLYKKLKDGDITMDAFNEKLIELSETTGGLGAMAKDATGGLATAWGNMKIAIAKGVTDTIEKIDEALGGTGKIADIILMMRDQIKIAFKSINKYVLSFVKTLKRVYDATKPLHPVLKDVAKAALIFGTVLGGMAMAAGAIAGIGALFTVIGSGVGIAILAVAGLVTGFVMAYQKIEPFRKGIDKLVSGFKALFKVISGDQDGGEGMAKKMGFSEDEIKKMVSFANGVSNVFNKIKNGAQSAVGLVQAVFAVFGGDKGSAIDILKKFGFTEETFNRIVTFKDGVMDTFGKLKEGFAQLGEFFVTKGQELAPTLDMLAEAFAIGKDVVVSIFTTLWAVLEPIFSALKNAIMIVADIAVIAFTNLVVPALKFAMQVFQLLWTVVGPLLKLLGSAIGLSFGVLKKVWDTILKPFVEFMTGLFSKMLGKIGEKIDSVKGNFEKFGGAIEKVAGWFDSFRTALSNFKVPNWLSKLGGGGTVKFENGGGGEEKGEGRYNGIKYVPRDNTPYRLHRGERVLTAKENKEHNKGGGGRAIVINMNGTVIREEADVDRLAEKMVRKFIAAGEGGA